MISIPHHDPCRKGRDGGVCGYCLRRAQEKADHCPDVDLEEAIAARWHPKTDKSIRDIPFDFDARAEITIERFFEHYEDYPHSRQSVNRRVERAAEHAPALCADEIFPHALRATAATHHVARGLKPAPLQAMFGWSKLETAQKYLQSSGGRTQRALRQVYSR